MFRSDWCGQHLVARSRRDIPRMLHVTPDVCKVPNRFADACYNVTHYVMQGWCVVRPRRTWMRHGNSIYIHTYAQIFATKSPRRGHRRGMRRLQIWKIYFHWGSFATFLRVPRLLKIRKKGESYTMERKIDTVRKKSSISIPRLGFSIRFSFETLIRILFFQIKEKKRRVYIIVFLFFKFIIFFFLKNVIPSFLLRGK